MKLRNFKKVLLCGVPHVIPRTHATRTYNMPWNVQKMKARIRMKKGTSKASKIIEDVCDQLLQPTTGQSACFVKKRTLKKNREMLIISMFEACETIMNAGKSNWDEGMLHILRGVNNDLVAADAKYHKACHASYVKKKKAENQFQKRIWRGKLVLSSSIKIIGWWNKTGPRSWNCHLYS